MKETLLIVDDSPENLFLLRRILKTTGYIIIEAEDGQQALEAVENNSIDLILLDVMMPGIDGFEVCRRIRADQSYENMPIIFLTAKNDPESISLGLQLGGDDYLSKPFHMKELVARVRNHLAHRLTKKKLEESNVSQLALLHILSHDLANPLSSIISLSEVIESAPELSTEFNPRIRDLAENSLELVGLVRQMRSLESKGLDLQAIQVSEAVNRCIGFNQDRAKAKGVALMVEEIPAELKVYAEMTSLVNTVLSNLITNAIKFSNSGSMIKVHVDGVEDQVRVRIVDQGIGMSERLLSQIFDVTKKTSRTGTAEERGTGFGMPLVRQFMSYYGGTITVESGDGDSHGTTVTLKFQQAERAEN